MIAPRGRVAMRDVPRPMTMLVRLGMFALATIACPRDENPTPPGTVANSDPGAVAALRATVAAPDSTEEPMLPAGPVAMPQAAVADAAHTLTILEVDARAGALDEQLTIFAARAKSEGRIPAVELRASWCEPCKKLDRLLGTGPVTDALAGTVLIRVDVDMFDDELSALGFTAPQIPSLYRVDGRGRPQGRPLSGADWARRSETQIAEALRGFLGR